LCEPADLLFAASDREAVVRELRWPDALRAVPRFALDVVNTARRTGALSAVAETLCISLGGGGGTSESS
jgi:hypothetical protein